MRINDDTQNGDEVWVLYDTTTKVLDLDLRFNDMVNANLYAVEDPSFKWAVLAGEIGVG